MNPSGSAAHVARRGDSVSQRSAAEPSRLRAWAVALVLIAAAELSVRVALISGSMPYVDHIDEMELSGRAARMLQTGDANPHFFEYPSLPIYLTAAGFGLGYLHARARQKVHALADIGTIAYPAYAQPAVVFPARVLFALLSVSSIVLAAWIAYLGNDVAASLAAVPVLAAISTLYLYLSWTYLNVDIVGAFFVLSTVAYGARRVEADWRLRDSAAVGALAGLAVACKYTLFPALLTGALAIAVSRAARKRDHLAVLAAAGGAAFLLVTPYCVIDVDTFLNDVGGAIRHYAHGHPGANGEPGTAQAAYYIARTVREYGPLAAGLALGGLAQLLATNWRRALIVTSFPVLHVAYMAQQRVHFIRHAVSYPLFLSVLIATALLSVPRWTTIALARMPPSPALRRAAAVAASVLAWAAFGLGLPWPGILHAYDLTPDSRTLAVRWLEANAPDGSTVLVPPELGLRVSKLAGRFHVVPIRIGGGEPPATPLARGAYVLVPRYGLDSRNPRGRALAAARNRDADRLAARVLVELGSRSVAVNYPMPLAGGNPSIRIVWIPRSGPAVSEPASDASPRVPGPPQP